MEEVRLVILALAVLASLHTGVGQNLRNFQWVYQLPNESPRVLVNTNSELFVVKRENSNLLLNNVLITQQQYNEAFQGSSIQLETRSGRRVTLSGNSELDGFKLDGVSVFGLGVNFFNAPAFMLLVGDQHRVDTSRPNWFEEMKPGTTITFTSRETGIKTEIKAVKGGQSILLNGMEVTQTMWNNANMGERVGILKQGRYYFLQGRVSMYYMTLDNAEVFNNVNYRVSNDNLRLPNGATINFYDINWIDQLQEGSLIISTQDGSTTVIKRQGSDILINNVVVSRNEWKEAIQGGEKRIAHNGGYVMLSGDGSLAGLRLNGKICFDINYSYFYGVLTLGMHLNGVAIDPYRKGFFRQLTENPTFMLYFTSERTGRQTHLDYTEDPNTVRINNVIISEDDWFGALNGEERTFSHNGRHTLSSRGTIDTLELDGRILFGESRVSISSSTFTMDYADNGEGKKKQKDDLEIEIKKEPVCKNIELAVDKNCDACECNGGDWVCVKMGCSEEDKVEKVKEFKLKS